jgi:putative transposase
LPGLENILKTSAASLGTVSDTGIEPVIGKDIGRPKKPYNSKEAQIIVLAYDRYRFGARMLEVAIRKILKTCISHNRIHMDLKASGLTQIPTRRKRRK